MVIKRALNHVRFLLLLKARDTKFYSGSFDIRLFKTIRDTLFDIRFKVDRLQ